MNIVDLTLVLRAGRAETSLGLFRQRVPSFGVRVCGQQTLKTPARKFTNWCPAMWMLKKAGLRSSEAACEVKPAR